MEVIRQKATDSEEFRSKQLRARDMLRGELDDVPAAPARPIAAP